MLAIGIIRTHHGCILLGCPLSKFFFKKKRRDGNGEFVLLQDS